LGSDSPLNLAIGGGGGEGLVLWAVQGTMRARGISAGGDFAGPAFDFGAGSLDTYFAGSIAFDSPGFALAWTRGPFGGTFRSSFAKRTTAALTSSITQLTSTSQVHSIDKIVKTPSGYALLINANLPPKALLIVPLDSTGNVTGPAHRLEGALYGWDL